jgi:hypothetical protein
MPVDPTIARRTSDDEIVGPAQVALEAALMWAINRGAPEHLVTEVAPLYWELAPKVLIRPEVAFAQAMVETANFTFPRCGVTVCPDFCNPCGMRTKVIVPGPHGEPETPDNHQKFPSWRVGVAAHVDHLALYVGRPSYPKPENETPDPRHFPTLAGKVTSLINLGDWWVTGGADARPDYGIAIRNRIAEMRGERSPEKTAQTISVTEEDDMLFLARLKTNPNLWMRGNGIQASRVRAANLDEVTDLLVDPNRGPVYHNPVAAGRPVITRTADVPLLTAEEIVAHLGDEMEESTP